MVADRTIIVLPWLALLLCVTDAFLHLPSSLQESYSQKGMIYRQISKSPSTKLYSAVRIEDMNVPESHRSLHEYLYDGEDEHELQKETKVDQNECDGSVFFNVEEWLNNLNPMTKQKLAGVYAVSDTTNTIQYIGYSRNIALSLRNHLTTFGSNIVKQVKIKSFSFPKKEELMQLQSTWLSSLEYVPTGNMNQDDDGNKGWESSSRSSSEAMTSQEKEKYSEIKMKLRKAMADTTLIDEQERNEPLSYSTSNEKLRANLKAAVEDDNWSAIIAEQSADTIDEKDGIGKEFMQSRGKENDEELEEEDMDAEDEEDRDIDILSPFENNQTTPSPVQGPSNKKPEMELTPENVDLVLDEVRPYLIADGGNIAVVNIDIEKRGIYLRLQGACGSCPSSTVTMKMGVERVLREKFSNLTTIEALAPLVEDELAGLSDEERVEKLTFSVGQKLEEVMPAIRGLGADSKIDSIDSKGVVTLAYKGPDKVKLGIVYALKSIEGVNDVITIGM